jgi:hypothetical protein
MALKLRLAKQPNVICTCITAGMHDAQRIPRLWHTYVVNSGNVRKFLIICGCFILILMFLGFLYHTDGLSIQCGYVAHGLANNSMTDA